jgi:hypothetical protein
MRSLETANLVFATVASLGLLVGRSRRFALVSLGPSCDDPETLEGLTTGAAAAVCLHPRSSRG